MPMDFFIDHARRLVVGRGTGVFTDADLFAYQREVWSHPEVAGYDELLDASGAEEILAPMPAGPMMQQLVVLAAATDDPSRTGKLAIVAPSPIAFGLAREYKTYREMNSRSNKEVAVFRTLTEALPFLGIEHLDNLPPATTIAAPQG